jgi:hypothetical protein
LTFALGFGNGTVIAIVALIILAATLTISPVVYQAVEKVEFFKVGGDNRLPHRGDLRRDLATDLD